MCLLELCMIPHKAAVTSHKEGSRPGEGRFVLGLKLCVPSRIKGLLQHLKQSFSPHSALRVYPGRFNHQMVLGESGV